MCESLRFPDWFTEPVPVWNQKAHISVLSLGTREIGQGAAQAHYRRRLRSSRSFQPFQTFQTFQPCPWLWALLF